MNPVYTGRDVSFIDTKQAQRLAENTLLSAEKFATIASQLGARYPSVEATDKAWRQLLYGAHHDGMRAPSRAEYLDLMGGWREAAELSTDVLDGALEHLGSLIDVGRLARGQRLQPRRRGLVRMSSTSPRSTFATMSASSTARARRCRSSSTPEASRSSRGTCRLSGIGRIDWPRAMTHRRPTPPAGALDGRMIENETYVARVDPGRGGTLVSLIDKRTDKEIVAPGAAANSSWSTANTRTTRSSARDRGT